MPNCTEKIDWHDGVQLSRLLKQRSCKPVRNEDFKKMQLLGCLCSADLTTQLKYLGHQVTNETNRTKISMILSIINNVEFESEEDCSSKVTLNDAESETDEDSPDEDAVIEVCDDDDPENMSVHSTFWENVSTPMKTDVDVCHKITPTLRKGTLLEEIASLQFLKKTTPDK